MLNFSETVEVQEGTNLLSIAVWVSTWVTDFDSRGFYYKSREGSGIWLYTKFSRQV
jgi:hypothetical protein